MSMHRRWSAKVHQPGWQSSGSVAECLSWPASWKTEPKPDAQLYPDLDYTATSNAVSGILRSRPLTPHSRICTPKPPSRNEWTSYKTDGNPYSYDSKYVTRTSPPPGPDIYKDLLYETSNSPARLYGQYENSNKYDAYAEAKYAHDTQTQRNYDPAQEELIRDYLVRKEIESYDRELDFERQKLHDERQQRYEDHIHNVLSRNRSINEGRISAKPPIPRPPSKGHPVYPKTAHPRKDALDTYRTNTFRSRPNSAVLALPQNDTSLHDGLTTKKVNFQLSRPTSAKVTARDYAKGNHFTQWRDATSPALRTATNDGLWKMPRFLKSAQPRISTHWDTDPRLRSADTYSQDKSASVNVNVECDQGDDMDVSLRVSHTASKVY